MSQIKESITQLHFLKEGDKFDFNSRSQVYKVIKCGFTYTIAKSLYTKEDIKVNSHRKVRKL